ncbi:MAG: alpha/beta hydrolase [Patulibacter sp.]
MARAKQRTTKGSRKTALSAAVTATAAGAAWGASYLNDRRRIAADPQHAALMNPVGGRSVPVRAGDGTDLRVRVFGPDGAPTVVFVHGWTCALEFWTLQIQALQGDLRLVAYDLRGHGESAPSSGGDYSIQAYAGDLDSVLRATVPAGERAVLVGHSLGAMTIVAWASDRRPDEIEDRVSAAGLFSTGVGDLITSALVLPASGVGDRIQQELTQLFLGSSAPLPRKASPVVNRVVQYVALCGAASPATVSFCSQMVLRCPRDVRANTGTTLSSLDLYEGVEALTVPTTVLVGTDDRLTPPVHAERLADRLPQLHDLVELPRVGHMAPVENPHATTAAIRSLVAVA